MSKEYCVHDNPQWCPSCYDKLTSERDAYREALRECEIAMGYRRDSKKYQMARQVAREVLDRFQNLPSQNVVPRELTPEESTQHRKAFDDVLRTHVKGDK